jgi:type I restriction enzyme M protein
LNRWCVKSPPSPSPKPLENKADVAQHIKRNDKDLICNKVTSIKNYAVNGALFYGLHLAQNTTYKKIIAFGISGNEKRHKISPIWINERGEYKELEDVETFTLFNEKNIDEYYTKTILKEQTPEEKTTEEILKDAKKSSRRFAELWQYPRQRQTVNRFGNFTCVA